MSDRELLEKAAKAAGWTGWQSKHGYWNLTSPESEDSTHCHHWNAYCPDTGEKLREPTFADAIAETNWNPLIDDGDALRLAVKLRMSILLRPLRVEVLSWPSLNAPILYGFGGCLMPKVETIEPYDDDPYAATRRAIVRAAAVLGERT